METKLTEEWKDIKGYEGRYQVSSFGRIKSLERDVVRNNWSGRITTKHVREKIKKPCLGPQGYMVTSLNKGNNSKRHSMHRIIAEAFIANPENKPFINHINGIRHDNRIENLEWCTPKENNIHSFQVLGRKSGMLGKKGALCKNSKPCIVIDQNGNEKIYPALMTACEELGLSSGTAGMVAKGIRKQTKGYRIYYLGKAAS
jgi:hypothetical protein